MEFFFHVHLVIYSIKVPVPEPSGFPQFRFRFRDHAQAYFGYLLFKYLAIDFCLPGARQVGLQLKVSVFWSPLSIKVSLRFGEVEVLLSVFISQKFSDERLSLLKVSP